MRAGTVASAITRPAGTGPFTGLLDALALPGSYAVVLPSLAHLGCSRTTAYRVGLIAETGARLMAVRGPVPQPDRDAH